MEFFSNLTLLQSSTGSQSLGITAQVFCAFTPLGWVKEERMLSVDFASTFRWQPNLEGNVIFEWKNKKNEFKKCFNFIDKEKKR